MNWNIFLKNQLYLRKIHNLWRYRNVVNKHDHRFIIFNQKKYLNFSSNDYLGLSMHPKIIEAWKNGFDKYGLSSNGSGHMIGYSDVHAKLEFVLSEWLGFSKALLFISGYAVNQCVIFTLMNKNDFILSDKLCHASIQEAAVLSPAKFKRFFHNNYENLNDLLMKNYDFFDKTLVITEGIFSMDGDNAPLDKIKNICKKKKVWLYVDDAHGIGTIGDEGKGSCDLYNIKPELLLVTFGKSFGLSGAVLLCNEITADYFLQYAKHLIYSTFISSAQAEAILEAIIQIRNADNLRLKLKNNINYFCELAKYYDLPILNSNSAIQPLIVGSNQCCLDLSKFLAECGFWVQAIRSPTVSISTARLRITLLANHLESDITSLLKTLNKFFRKYVNK